MDDLTDTLIQRQRPQRKSFIYDREQKSPLDGLFALPADLYNLLLDKVKPLPLEQKDINLPNQGGGIDPRIIEKLFGK